MCGASGPVGTAAAGVPRSPCPARAICRPEVKPSRYRFCSAVKSPDMRSDVRSGRFYEVMAFVKELEHALAAFQVRGIAGKREALARAGERHVEDLSDPRGRAVGHHHDTVGEEHRLVDV